MSIIFFLLPITLAIAGGFLWAFFWAARRGEFDDLETPAHRILFDDLESDPPAPHAATHPRITESPPP